MDLSSHSSPSGVENRQWQAASLAEMIRSGALDIDPSPSRTSRQSSMNMSRQLSQQSDSTPPRSFVPQRPLVQSWSNHMINMEPEPAFLAETKQGKVPSVKVLLEHSPFSEPCLDLWQPSTNGVVLVKNIPYGTLKNEIVSAVGRTANIVTQPEGTGFEAIHIIMERSTGKTMDCFVELSTEHEAHKVFDRFHHRSSNGKAPRIQDRHVQIEISSQAAMMRELFPRAKCVTWEGQVPLVFTPKEAYDSGFRGFLTSEEMTMTLKHAQTPSRSPFANRNLQRPYENMISTLNKFPWFATNHITIEDRCLLFNITSGLLQQLMRSFDNNSNPAQLTRELLHQLLSAALTVPFSQQQKSNIVSMMYAGRHGTMVEMTPYQSLGSIGHWWPFEVLDKKLTVHTNVLEYYVSLIREATMTGPDGRSQPLMQATNTMSPFGQITLVYGTDDLGTMTLNDVALKESDTINSLLIKAIRKLSATSGLAVLQESPDMKPAEFRPSDHDVFDKYSAAHSPRSGSGSTSWRSASGPLPQSDSRLLDRSEALSDSSGSGQGQLSPASLDGGVHYQPQPFFNRAPGYGRLNAASAPFSPRHMSGGHGPMSHARSSGMSSVGFSGPDTFLPRKPPVGFGYRGGVGGQSIPFEEH